MKKLINKSYYCTIGHLGKETDVDILAQYINHNLPVLKEFKGHIVVTNYSGQYQDQNARLWKHYLPDVILIDLPINRGHSFGIADQENAIIDYCKENNIDWICKTSNDILFEKELLNKNLPDADFYYMNGIGYGGLKKYNYDLDLVEKEDFYPQTNFYFINVSKIDYLYDKDYVNETYNYIQSLENYNGRVWEYIEGWSCEDFLKQCVERNNLSKYHLVSQETYRRLLKFIKSYQVHDCSHKNLMIDSVCHYQFFQDQILYI